MTTSESVQVILELFGRRWSELFQKIIDEKYSFLDEYQDPADNEYLILFLSDSFEDKTDFSYLIK